MRRISSDLVSPANAECSFSEVFRHSSLCAKKSKNHQKLQKPFRDDQDQGSHRYFSAVRFLPGLKSKQLSLLTFHTYQSR